MNKIEINGKNYEILRNDKECINIEELKEKITDYFYEFDYIFGDYSYDKVRLKGFLESNNKNVKRINDIKYLEDYIENYCSFGSRVFLLKKLK